MRVFQTQSRKVSNRAYKTTEKAMYDKACSKIRYAGKSVEYIEKTHNNYLQKLKKDNDEWFNNIFKR